MRNKSTVGPPETIVPSDLQIESSGVLSYIVAFYFWLFMRIAVANKKIVLKRFWNPGWSVLRFEILYRDRNLNWCRAPRPEQISLRISNTGLHYNCNKSTELTDTFNSRGRLGAKKRWRNKKEDWWTAATTTDQ